MHRRLRRIQKSLSLADADVQRLQATRSSPPRLGEALRYYSEGIQLVGLGEHLRPAASKHSTNADPKFALAFSRLAQSLAQRTRHRRGNRLANRGEHRTAGGGAGTHRCRPRANHQRHEKAIGLYERLVSRGRTMPSALRARLVVGGRAIRSCA